MTPGSTSFYLHSRDDDCMCMEKRKKYHPFSYASQPLHETTCLEGPFSMKERVVYTVCVTSSCSAFGGVDGQAILKSISYDNMPHPDFYARLKFHVIRPFPLDTSFLGLQFPLRKCNVFFSYFRLTNRRACIITLSASLSSVDSSLSHRIRHRNFTFGTHVYICPYYLHIKWQPF